MGYLKTGKVLIESINETIEIVELNALAEGLMVDFYTKGDMLSSAATAVKYGTKKWAESTLDDIKIEMNSTMIHEIAEKVSAISGLEDDREKKSESTQQSGSSTS